MKKEDHYNFAVCHSSNLLNILRLQILWHAFLTGNIDITLEKKLAWGGGVNQPLLHIFF